MHANNNKFPQYDPLFPPVGDSSRLLVGCRKEDYSASRIARAVEDCDAHLLNLNVTHMGYGNGDNGFDFPVVFDLRVSHRNTEGISRSLRRYGYTVIDSDDIDDDNVDIADSTTSNIDSLLRFLEI